MAGFKIKKEVSLNTILWIGGGAAAYFYLIKPALEGLGLKESVEDLQNKASEKKTKGWDPNFWKIADKQSKKVLYLKTKAAHTAAKMIYKAFGGHHEWSEDLKQFFFFPYKIADDKEEQIYGVFKQLKTQIQVSQVVSAYFWEYKADLFRDLKAKLSDDELNVIVKIVDSLPKYYPG